MPPTHLLGRRDLLVVCWRFIPQFFALLSPTAQWELHRFYGPSLTLTDEQTLARIKAAIELEPSLPHKAGKHYKIIFDHYKRYADQVGKENFAAIQQLLHRDLVPLHGGPLDLPHKGYRPRRIAVYAIVNPEPNALELAKIFLRIAEQG